MGLKSILAIIQKAGRRTSRFTVCVASRSGLSSVSATAFEIQKISGEAGLEDFTPRAESDGRSRCVRIMDALQNKFHQNGCSVITEMHSMQFSRLSSLMINLPKLH